MDELGSQGLGDPDDMVGIEKIGVYAESSLID